MSASSASGPDDANHRGSDRNVHALTVVCSAVKKGYHHDELVLRQRKRQYVRTGCKWLVSLYNRGAVWR
jgi:hypothetical protein